MTRLLLFVIKIGILFSMICCTQSHTYQYAEIRSVNVADYNLYFPQYCEMDSIDNQTNFALCSFVGDYKGVLRFATKHAMLSKQHHASRDNSPEDLESMKQNIELLAANSANNTSEENAMLIMMRQIISANGDAVDMFKDKQQINAKKYIVDESERYHFLLLNEAHYNAQSRAFTMELLKPLWEKGYRYLALEALNHIDINLMQRGYPLLTTGFYFKESGLGNLVREALSIGYKLIPYEAKEDALSLTDRDSEQAQNIFDSTLKNDSIGKVIVHAGYGHISESPSNSYKPMGYHLGKRVNQPIFTIDQQTMTELCEEEAMHPFYQYASHTYKFNEPVVFLDNEHLPLVDPISGVDVQVYHPKTTYTNGRPTWLLKADYKAYSINKEILTFKGHLLQATLPTEEPLTVPVDQIIIKEGNALILKPGHYALRIIDCNGTLIGEGGLDAW